MCKSKRSRKEEEELRSPWGSVHWSRSGAEYMRQCAGRRDVSRWPVPAGGMQSRWGMRKRASRPGMCEWDITGRTGCT
jgi:hypothetical protein